MGDFKKIKSALISVFDKEGIDEIVYMDAVASLYKRSSILPLVESSIRNIFVPISVGGGSDSVKNARPILQSGAEKIIINTSAIQNPSLIRILSDEYGRQCIVISIQAKKRNDYWEALTHCGRVSSGLDVVEWMQKTQELGAGELLITSVDNDGTSEGYDLELIKLINEAVSIPVIAHGGAGPLNNISDAAKIGITGLALGSNLNYSTIDNLKNDAKLEGNTIFLKSGDKYNKIITNSIFEIKSFLINQGFECRPI